MSPAPDGAPPALSVEEARALAQRHGLERLVFLAGQILCFPVYPEVRSGCGLRQSGIPVLHLLKIFHGLVIGLIGKPTTVGH